MVTIILASGAIQATYKLSTTLNVDESWMAVEATKSTLMVYICTKIGILGRHKYWW